MGTVHNEIRTASNLVTGIKNALGVEEAEAGVERFSETLQPIIDTWNRVDWAILRGERIWSVAPNQIAVAAEFSQVGVRNPTGSNRIVVVKGWNIWALAPGAGKLQTYDLTVGASSAVVALGTVSSRDTRLPVQTGLTTQGIATHQAAQLGGRLVTFSPQDNQYNTYLNAEIVLSPGFDLYIGPNAVNLGVGATLWGFERPAFKQELTIRS